MIRVPSLPIASATFVRGIVASLLSLTLACSPRPGDQASALPDSARSAPDTTRLPRNDVTVADRARWLERLHWPNACEEDFVKTHLTDDGGLEFHSVAPGLSLVIVRCALGAYQPTSVVLHYDERAAAATLLEFPTYESLDGMTLAPARTAELVGEISVLDARHELTVLSLARQIGDCGTWARYQVQDGTPVLSEFAERVRCPDEPGARANPTPGQPPQGWKPVPLK